MSPGRAPSRIARPASFGLTRPSEPISPSRQSGLTPSGWPPGADAVMPALIFGLDGTLVDPVYAHGFAWERAFAEAGLAIDGWRIHRRIGMSGGLFVRAAARELGHGIDLAA